MATAVVLLVTAACGSEQNGDATAIEADTAETAQAEEPSPAIEGDAAATDAAQTEAEAPSPAVADEPAQMFTTPTGISCSRRESDVVPDRPTFSEPPELALDEGVAYSATLETSCGTIVLELDAENAPITTNNFVVLTCAGFYDGITFHRAVPGFVIQGGDPLGTGTGGPGYAFEDRASR